MFKVAHNEVVCAFSLRRFDVTKNGARFQSCMWQTVANAACCFPSLSECFAVVRKMKRRKRSGRFWKGNSKKRLDNLRRGKFVYDVR